MPTNGSRKELERRYEEFRQKTLAEAGLSSSSSQAQQGESGGEVGISFEDFCVAFHDYGDGSSAAGRSGTPLAPSSPICAAVDT